MTSTMESPQEYRVDVLASGEVTWATNALRFADKDSAEIYARDLFRRWFLVERMSVVPTSVPERQPYVEGEREELDL